jgi:hypothetical protein
VAPPPRRNLDFFCAVVIVGLLAGAAGLATTEVLRFAEHVTYHYTFGTLLAGVAGSSPIRRAVGPMVGGALAAVGWWILRRRTEVPPLAQTIARRGRIPRLSWSSTPCCRCCWSAPGRPSGGKEPHANSQRP